MITRLITAVLVLFSTASLIAGGAAAHELVLPALVHAAPGGHFAYEAIVIVSEPVLNGYMEIDGTDNTDIGHFHADGFCMYIREPGVYSWTIEGSLIDIGQPGSVSYEEYLCDGWLGQGTTTIVPPVVTGDTLNWSAIKGLYR